MPGFFASIAPYLTQASNAVSSYDESKRNAEQQNLGLALQLRQQEEQQQRQAFLDQLEANYRSSQIDANRALAGQRDAVGVRYAQDADGNYVALPTRLPATGGGAGAGTAPATPTLPIAGAPAEFTAPTASDLAAGLTGRRGSKAYNPVPPIAPTGQQPTAAPVAPVAPVASIGIPTGIKGMRKPTPLTTMVMPDGTVVRAREQPDGTLAPVLDAQGNPAPAAPTAAPRMVRSGSGYVTWNGAKWVPSGVVAPDAASQSPEVLAAHRQTEILKRAETLMKPTTNRLTGAPIAGMDMDAAMTKAAGEYDAAASAASSHGGQTREKPSGLSDADAKIVGAIAARIKAGGGTLDGAVASLQRAGRSDLVSALKAQIGSP